MGCVYWEGDDALCLVDPLVPQGKEEAFWLAFDRELERLRRPLEVLITIYWHTRDARRLAERYSGRIWAHAPARAPVERRLGCAVNLFEAGDRLPGGIEAIRARGSEVVFWIAVARTLVTGDVILAEEGELRLCPESWHPRGGGHERVRESLRALADLPVERVLTSHGEPVLEDAHAKLARLLSA